MAPLQIDVALTRRTFELNVALMLGSETVAVIGPSGSGKSSLLRAIAGLERATRGRIALSEETWLDSAAGVHISPQERRVGYVPQDYGLFAHLSVAGNVRFAGRRERPELLERFGIAHLARARPGELSGGERQRVALARALAREPRVLLLDEPFAALDLTTRTRVRDELAQELNKMRLPTLLVTHAFDDALAIASRVAMLVDGQFAQVASPDELLRAPATASVALLTGANVHSGLATSDHRGSTVCLDGGGRLKTAADADGRTTVAIHPWELAITDVDPDGLSDRVVNVRQQGGVLLVRLERFIVHAALPQATDPRISEGSLVGLRANPDDVRIVGLDR